MALVSYGCGDGQSGVITGVGTPSPDLPVPSTTGASALPSCGSTATPAVGTWRAMSLQGLFTTVGSAISVPAAFGAAASARQVGVKHFDDCPFGHAHWYVIVFPQPSAWTRPSAGDWRLMWSTEQTRLYAARSFTLLNLGAGAVARPVATVE